MELFDRKKSELSLWKGLLEIISPEQREEVERHFSGMGNHELSAIFSGPHWEPAVTQIRRLANMKPKQIKMYIYTEPRGGCNCYIRGTFTKEDVQFFFHSLKSCIREGDNVFINDTVKKLVK